MTAPVADVALDSEDLCRRLRGQYRIPIRDGLGAAGGEEPDNANEFVRTFPTSPIMHEAADTIEAIRADLEAQASAYKEALERIRGEAYGWTPSKAAHALGSIAHEALLNGADR